MRNFNNDDDFNDEFGDDFFGRWEKFNERMKNDRDFRREINKFQKDLEDIMRQFTKGGSNDILGFRNNIDFTKLTPEDMDMLSNIPEDEMEIEKGEDDNGEWETKTWTSPDGSVSYTSFSRSSSFEDFGNDNFDEMMYNKSRKRNIVDPEKEKYLKLSKLKKALDYCVEQEDYEKAAELKKEIDSISNSLNKK